MSSSIHEDDSSSQHQNASGSKRPRTGRPKTIEDHSPPSSKVLKSVVDVSLFPILPANKRPIAPRLVDYMAPGGTLRYRPRPEWYNDMSSGPSRRSGVSSQGHHRRLSNTDAEDNNEEHSDSDDSHERRRPQQQEAHAARRRRSRRRRQAPAAADALIPPAAFEELLPLAARVHVAAAAAATAARHAGSDSENDSPATTGIDDIEAADKTPSTFGKDFDPALHVAIRENATQAALSLLSMGAPIGAENVKGVTPLILAAQKGNLAVVEDLLSRGASPSATSVNGTTAVLQASHFGHLEIIHTLLNAGGSRLMELANYNHTTPLMRAAQEGHIACVRLLLKRGALTNRRNRVQMTSLMLASQRGHAKICQLLINYGADLDAMTAQDSTSLLLACKRTHMDVVKVLVTAGCELWVRDARGRTAREVAQRRELEDIAFMLDPLVQIAMMRQEARSQRSIALMNMWTLLQQERATIRLEQGHNATIHKLVPLLERHDLPYHLSQSTTVALLRTMTLPAPLVEAIAQFAPLPAIWDKRIGLLTKRCLVNADAAVVCGLDLVDEIIEEGGFCEACDSAEAKPPNDYESWVSRESSVVRIERLHARISPNICDSCFLFTLQKVWKSCSRRNSKVVASRPENRVRPNATLATVHGPQDPKRPSLVELRRQAGFLQVLAHRFPNVGQVLMAAPYNVPPVVVQQLITISDIQSLVRRMGSRGVHFDPPVAMDLIMLTSRLCSWYSRERDEQ
jgi:ankyrin repeat protein